MTDDLAAEGEPEPEFNPGIAERLPRKRVVDWVPSHGVWSDGVMFIYDGGRLDDDEVAGLKPTDDELTGLRFLTYHDAAPC